MLFPYPPYKPTPPDKTITNESVYRSMAFADSYSNTDYPSLEFILASLNVPAEDYKHVTISVDWSEPDFPTPAYPVGIRAIYSKVDEAPNPFYESEYKEYLRDLEQYCKELQIYKVAVAGLAETQQQKYTDSLLDIMEKVKEIEEEIVEIGNIV